jgi:hypothetical protein
VRAISILGCVVVLSAGAGTAWAGGGTCSIPSCRPRPNAVVTLQEATVVFDWATLVLLQTWATLAIL